MLPSLKHKRAGAGDDYLRDKTIESWRILMKSWLYSTCNTLRIKYGGKTELKGVAGVDVLIAARTIA